MEFLILLAILGFGWYCLLIAYRYGFKRGVQAGSRAGAEEIYEPAYNAGYDDLLHTLRGALGEARFADLWEEVRVASQRPPSWKCSPDAGLKKFEESTRKSC